MTKENLKELLSVIKLYDIDYRWLEADWQKNGRILQRILSDVFYDKIAPFDIVWKTVNGDDFFFSVGYYDERMNCFITVLEDIENEFDFTTPADVIKLMRHYAETVNEFKNFYQVKIS